MIKIELNTIGNGTVTGNQEYNVGEVVECTASPAEGSEFIYWLIGDEIFSNENPLKFIATNNISITAKFVENSQTKFRASTVTNEMPYTIASNILLSNGQTLEEYLKL